jgi:hypothetical protein
MAWLKVESLKALQRYNGTRKLLRVDFTDLSL